MKERMDWTDIARFYLLMSGLQAISRDFSADIDRALPARPEPRYLLKIAHPAGRMKCVF